MNTGHKDRGVSQSTGFVLELRLHQIVKSEKELSVSKDHRLLRREEGAEGRDTFRGDGGSRHIYHRTRQKVCDTANTKGNSACRGFRGTPT